LNGEDEHVQEICDEISQNLIQVNKCKLDKQCKLLNLSRSGISISHNFKFPYINDF